MSRIVAGRARGQNLATPSGSTTRPTTDRVREAFFSVLASWNGTADREAEEQLDQLSFLDLYAGSGAVGLEAASRGAGPVVLVESDRRAADVIAANIAATGLKQVQLWRAKVGQVLSRPITEAGHGQVPACDVVWFDPPYGLATAEVDEQLAQVLAGGWVRDDGLVVVERAVRDQPPSLPGTDAWSRSYGETVLYFFAPLADAASDDGAGQEAPMQQEHPTSQDRP